METLAGLPFAWLELDRDGEVAGAPIPPLPAGTTDLIVLSHGWKNDAADAQALYAGILGHMLAAAGAERGGRRFAAIGIAWPAFRFRPDLSLVPADDGVAVSGGAAAVGAPRVSTAALRAEATAVGAALGMAGADLAGFVDQAQDAAGGGGAADAFVDRLRAALGVADAATRADHGPLLADPGRALVADLGRGADFAAAAPPAELGAGAGFTPAGFVQAGARLLAGGKAAVATILNQATYFEMKARAGTIGRALAAILAAGAVPPGVRLHLVGHSFGARLVTAAAAGLPAGSVASLSLLQGAFSHNGLGQAIGHDRVRGGFRDIVERRVVTGPILVTHTHRDTAVGLLYAVASFASGAIANAVGDLVQKIVGGPDDLHGGLGANGALALLPGEAVAHVAVAGAALPLAAGRINNVRADAIVSGHNDVANADVGALVWQAVR